jgi:hypothetical protein
MNHLYKAPKVSHYVYNVKGKIFGSIKFKTKIKTIMDMFKEIKDVENSLRKKYKTKKISIMKDTTGNKEWMEI